MKIKSSILKRLQFYMSLFGIMMGFIFPVYANFFVTFKEGMFIYFAVGCILAGITVGVVSFLFVKVILLRPLLKVSDVANNIKCKDISGQIDIESNDSVGDIVKGLNAAVCNLREFVADILKISSLIDDIIQRTDTRDKSISPVAKIETSIGQVTNISDCMKKLSERIISIVEQGKIAALSNEHKLKDTTNNVNGLSELIESLSQNSEKVHDIMSMINDIALKTNMLSLNASIEAASAGEYGKSFAVVASEVRNLAKNVADSAKKITDTVYFIQNDIKTAKVFIETIIIDVNENNINSDKIKEQLSEIVKITNYNVEANNDLAKSVNNLNNSFLEIQKAFELLSNNSNSLQGAVDSYVQ